MRDLAVLLLASFVISYALIVLVSADRSRDSTTFPVAIDNQERISDVGLRVVFRR